jgi:hypothetical protein
MRITMSRESTLIVVLLVFLLAVLPSFICAASSEAPATRGAPIATSTIPAPIAPIAPMVDTCTGIPISKSVATSWPKQDKYSTLKAECMLKDGHHNGFPPKGMLAKPYWMIPVYSLVIGFVSFLAKVSRDFAGRSFFWAVAFLSKRCCKKSNQAPASMQEYFVSDYSSAKRLLITFASKRYANIKSFDDAMRATISLEEVELLMLCRESLYLKFEARIKRDCCDIGVFCLLWLLVKPFVLFFNRAFLKDPDNRVHDVFFLGNLRFDNICRTRDWICTWWISQSVPNKSNRMMQTAYILEKDIFYSTALIVYWGYLLAFVSVWIFYHGFDGYQLFCVEFLNMSGIAESAIFVIIPAGVSFFGLFTLFYKLGTSYHTGRDHFQKDAPYSREYTRCRGLKTYIYMISAAAVLVLFGCNYMLGLIAPIFTHSIPMAFAYFWFIVPSIWLLRVLVNFTFRCLDGIGQDNQESLIISQAVPALRKIWDPKHAQKEWTINDFQDCSNDASKQFIQSVLFKTRTTLGNCKNGSDSVVELNAPLTLQELERPVEVQSEYSWKWIVKNIILNTLFVTFSALFMGTLFNYGLMVYTYRGSIFFCWCFACMFQLDLLCETLFERCAHFQQVECFYAKNQTTKKQTDPIILLAVPISGKEYLDVIVKEFNGRSTSCWINLVQLSNSQTTKSVETSVLQLLSSLIQFRGLFVDCSEP